MADRLLVREHSRIRMDGTPAEVFQRAWELREIGLSIPQTTQVLLKLREMGLPVNSGVYTLKQAVEELLRVKGGAGSC